LKTGPDRLKFGPFSAAGATVRLAGSHQRGLFRRPKRSGGRREYRLPNSPPPAGKAIVLWRPYAFGQSTQPTSRASFVSYFPFGRKPSWKFALAFSTCMIPLKISRSSLRQGPVGLPAKRLDLRPLLIVDPKQMRFHRRASKSVDQPLESKHG
jgi:hypothetical protein